MSESRPPLVDADDPVDARLQADDAAAAGWPTPGNLLGRSRRRRRTQPAILTELLLIAVGWGAYSAVRNVAPTRAGLAQENARWVWEFQATLGLAFERAVNHAVESVTWLIVAMNYYYATAHFVVTIAVLVWLFRRRPSRYKSARLALFATTCLALVGYYLFPLAPPRLMYGMDFIDTLVVHETWGSFAVDGTTASALSNQYAAMPSLHAAWAIWCGITLAVLARRHWVKVLGVLHAGLTLVVIVATANHFWLDAVGGLACLALGYLIAWRYYRRPVYRLPWQTPAARASAEPARP